MIELVQVATEPEARAFKSELAADDPASPVAQIDAADALARDGKLAEADAVYRKAIARLEQLVVAFPRSVEHLEPVIYSHFAQRALLQSQKQTTEAQAISARLTELYARLERDFGDTTTTKEAIADRMVVLGEQLLAGKMPDATVALFAEALRLVPRWRLESRLNSPRSKLALALLDQKKYEQAEPLLRTLGEDLKHQPEHLARCEICRGTFKLTATHLARLYDETGRTQEAAQCRTRMAEHTKAMYRVVAESVREHAKTGKLNDLLFAAWFLSTAPSGKARDAAAALDYAQKAIAVAPVPAIRSFETLAAAYAESGQFDEAVSTQEQAVAIATDSERPIAQTRLKLYQSHKPFRSRD